MLEGLSSLLKTPRRPVPAEENACTFVSSRGILKSCGLHARLPKSSSPKIPFRIRIGVYAPMTELYLCTDMVPRFAEKHLERVRHPFTLVSGDSDRTVASGSIAEDILLQFLEHPRLIAWHAQNCDFEHPKLHPIPIGLDYHTISNSRPQQGPHPWGEALSPLHQERQMRAIARGSGTLAGRKPIAFANWHFQLSRGNRHDCQQHTDTKAVLYQEAFLPRDESWQMNAQFAFTLSPHGNGLDCHRTWEALLLGSIPVVKRSCLDGLYEGLPVVIVDDWREVTPRRLADELNRIAGARFQFSRLELAYWMAKIRRQPFVEAPALTFDEFIQAAPKITDACHSTTPEQYTARPHSF